MFIIHQSSFNIMGDQWTSFNENYIDIYKCKKKGTKRLFFEFGEEVI